MITVGILTVSTRAARGVYKDESGPALSKLVKERLGVDVAENSIVPDDLELIKDTLILWADQRGYDLILTTGGTGFAPSDVAPEATRAVIQREAPGLVIGMIQAGLRVTPHAMLSRAVAGIRGHTLIINLPGSPKAAAENLEQILPVLPHGLELLQESPGADRRHEFKRNA
jgi:molybdopterin adenylyltransferase